MRYDLGWKARDLDPLGFVVVGGWNDLEMSVSRKDEGRGQD